MKIAGTASRGRLSVRIFSLILLAAGSGKAAEQKLYIGGATTSITPELPVALSGQMYARIARKIKSEVTASALAIESRDAHGASLDQAIMVSCDLVAIREGILELVRERVKRQLPGFDPKKLFMNATHSHTAPVMVPGKYTLPENEGVNNPADYRKFLADRVSQIAVKAWSNRKPGAAGWGLGHAVVGQNRRIVYGDGRAQMYGATNRAGFREIEGYEYHGVDVLFFWDEKEKLIATAINVACPSQEVESISEVSADFWAPVRGQLRREYGKELAILAWAGAAGDQSPHLMYNRAAENRMRKLRGLEPLNEIARRIVAAWEEAYAGAKQEIKTDLPFAHQVEEVELPNRKVSDEEFKNAQKQYQELAKDVRTIWKARWYQDVMDRYRGQHDGTIKPYRMELHVLRLGDISISTNPFELFTDYGIQLKARARSLQTFVVQLTGPGTYLPTERAVRGGGYSAIIESNVVGPAGGQTLVNRTVETINSLWPEK